MAYEKGYNTVGLQNYGECWADSSPAYDKLGAAQNCGILGTEQTNVVWVKTEQILEYKYMGCYKDDKSKLIPNFLGKVTSPDECRKLAIKASYDTFSLQYGGECYGGNKPYYYKLGKETNQGNCPTLGGVQSNQVYQSS